MDLIKYRLCKDCNKFNSESCGVDYESSIAIDECFEENTNNESEDK